MADQRFGPFEPVRLTADEWEVLDLLRLGLGRQALANRLGVGEEVARFRIGNVGAKLRLLAQM